MNHHSIVAATLVMSTVACASPPPAKYVELKTPPPRSEPPPEYVSTPTAASPHEAPPAAPRLVLDAGAARVVVRGSAWGRSGAAPTFDDAGHHAVPPPTTPKTYAPSRPSHSTWVGGSDPVARGIPGDFGEPAAQTAVFMCELSPFVEAYRGIGDSAADALRRAVVTCRRHQDAMFCEPRDARCRRLR